MCLRSAERAAQSSGDLLDRRRLRPTSGLLKHILSADAGFSGFVTVGDAAT
jgi:hypothetical protein